MGNKRKRNRYFASRSSEAGNNQDSAISDSSKRRRLSEDTYQSNHMSVPNETNIRLSHDDDDAGWTTVPPKNHKYKQSRQDGNNDGNPRLRFHQTYQSQLRIRDMRDLGMYVLADEVAPKWVAVAESKSIKKVVVLMLPGLDKSLLERVRKIRRHPADRKDDNEQNRLNKGTTDAHTQPTLHSAHQISPSTTESKFQTKTAERLVSCASKLKDTSHAQEWLFEHVLSVQAPGDAKTSRVHSPLQAMLLGPERDQKKISNATETQASKQAPTPITDFVHSADELREAEFPIHPATFTSQVDAEYEATRREQTGQSLNSGWVDTHVVTSTPKTDTNTQDPISKGLSLYSLDCEMVQTTDDIYSLARVSMISYPTGKIILDKYVKPSLPIKNYFTQYSGITSEILAPVSTTLQDIQAELLSILDSSCILLGHSLESDLNALKLTHPFLVDTSIIYPHPRGLPLRSSLKYLANKYLKREIQAAGAAGHNSVEDAQAVLDLVKQKCDKGPKWGTMEANGEPVFKRLKDLGRTSAMVDYGTPERGFGRDATFPIGCQDDDEVTAGVVRAVSGDQFFDFEVPVTGADYVWGRLRALEYARGWVTGPQLAQDAVEKADGEGNESKNAEKEAEQEDLDAIALQTLERVQRIHDALPAKSLLILFSGTGDMRPVLRLQAQQQAYRREFKVKKWDELTVKWTDTEEQALRRACADARAGWAVCTIK